MTNSWRETAVRRKFHYFFMERERPCSSDDGNEPVAGASERMKERWARCGRSWERRGAGPEERWGPASDLSVARDARGLQWGLRHVPGAVCFVVDKTGERFSLVGFVVLSLGAARLIGSEVWQEGDFWKEWMHILASEAERWLGSVHSWLVEWALGSEAGVFSIASSSIKVKIHVK